MQINFLHIYKHLMSISNDFIFKQAKSYLRQSQMVKHFYKIYDAVKHLYQCFFQMKVYKRHITKALNLSNSNVPKSKDITFYQFIGP